MVPQHHNRNVWLVAVVLGAVAGTGVAQTMPQALTDVPGDPGRGKAVAVNSDMGNCLICHGMPIAEVPEGASGDIGPDLAGVGSRLHVAELRQRIVDPKQLNPETVMPGYYVTAGLNRVQARFVDQTILTAQQVEDLVAYLATLR